MPVSITEMIQSSRWCHFWSRFVLVPGKVRTLKGRRQNSISVGPDFHIVSQKAIT